MLRVAVVDDEQYIGRIIDHILDLDGLGATVVSNEGGALPMLPSEGRRAAILDIPGPSGVGLAILHESSPGEIEALPVLTLHARRAAGGPPVRSGST